MTFTGGTNQNIYTVEHSICKLYTIKICLEYFLNEHLLNIEHSIIIILRF